jgi:hypothetical protein
MGVTKALPRRKFSLNCTFQEGKLKTEPHIHSSFFFFFETHIHSKKSFKKTTNKD